MKPLKSMSREHLRKPLHYDPKRHRVWIRGQRCHHGATGVVLASAGAMALVAVRLRMPQLAGLIAAGGLLMAHDWKDRGVWFARGA